MCLRTVKKSAQYKSYNYLWRVSDAGVGVDVRVRVRVRVVVGVSVGVGVGVGERMGMCGCVCICVCCVVASVYICIQRLNQFHTPWILAYTY